MVKGNLANALYALTNLDEMRAEREAHPKYNDVLKTDNGEITVDTCWVADCCWYETGIQVHGTWYIVQKDISPDMLKTAHERWVKIMRENPFKELRDMWDEDGDLDG